MQICETKAVTLVGASEFRKKDLLDCLDFAPTLIAVDGGANNLQDLKIFPKYIVGDMDSIRNSEVFSRQGTELIHIAEQDTTDFDKSLRVFNRCKYFLAVGFLGKRSDHYLGAFSTILRNPNLKVILVNKYDVIFLMPRRFLIMLPKKTRLSLFPFAEVQGVKSKGLKYPIDGINFTPFGMTGISNETVDEQVEIEVKTKKMLLILPRKFLKKVISQIN